MASFMKNIALVALLSTSATLTRAQGTAGVTTRYWDCCKPTCAWNTATGLVSRVKTCSITDAPLADDGSVQSGCTGGSAYMCSDQSPWAVSDSLAYGFAAVNSASPSCCQCYQLTFTSGPKNGAKMIVQATNTGNDVSGTQFDLAMPGGGFGQFDGCSKEWNANSAVWGAQYGGNNADTCDQFPAALQAGCKFRFDWMQFNSTIGGGGSNPTVNYEAVACPLAITTKSGCVKTGDTPYGPAVVGSGAPAAPAPAPPVSTAVAPPAKPVTTTVVPPMNVGSTLTTAAKASPTNTVAKYGQCGGQSYTGSKICASGSTCKFSNDWYSQCLESTIPAADAVADIKDDDEDDEADETCEL